MSPATQQTLAIVLVNVGTMVLVYAFLKHGGRVREFAVHVLCSALALVLRLLGRHVHVGEKRPCPECDGRGRFDMSHHFPEYVDCGACNNDNPEGRYIDRYAILGGACTNEGLRGFVSRWLGVNVWLQRIWRPDADRNPHDHPWENAGSLVLSGGYTELREAHTQVQDDSEGHGFHLVRHLRAGFVNLLPRGVYHMIVDVLPRTWTLFVTSRAHGQGWGFLVEDADGDIEHVDHEEYFRLAKIDSVVIPAGTLEGIATTDPALTHIGAIELEPATERQPDTMRSSTTPPPVVEATWLRDPVYPPRGHVVDDDGLLVPAFEGDQYSMLPSPRFAVSLERAREEGARIAHQRDVQAELRAKLSSIEAQKREYLDQKREYLDPKERR